MTGIYLIQDNGQLVEMTEKPFDSEDLLQKLLADYPSLLPGEQIDSVAPRRWLLISREMAVPDDEDSSGRWTFIEWATTKEMPIRWGKGRIDGSCIPKISHKGKNSTFFKVWTNATIEIFAWESPFNSKEKKAELLNRLKSVVGTSIAVHAYCWYIPFSVLNDEIVFNHLLQVLDWAINEIQSS